MVLWSGAREVGVCHDCSAGGGGGLGVSGGVSGGLVEGIEDGL